MRELGVRVAAGMRALRIRACLGVGMAVLSSAGEANGVDWNLLGDPLSRSTSVYSSSFEIDRLVKSGHAWSRG